MKKPDISSKKDIIKLTRSIFQTAILLLLLVVVIKALFSLLTYRPYQASDVTTADKGFIAISYFGIDRKGNSYLVSSKHLEEQLEALYQYGYKTITQADIQNYYENGTPLPDKALFLMFEDGRRDTCLFAQKIMEKYNYKASISSYAEKLSNDEGKALTEKELLDLEQTTFWELGTNGYRLSYINVFDRYEHYLGELTPLEFQQASPSLGFYNHYLMDFIRDEDGIPKESSREMEARIRADYTSMEELYTKGIGYLPNAYVLMHSNTGAFGNNDKVSAVNEACIKELFAMNFNREGFSYNDRNNSIYDLTRMQPQPYWSTNHFLMRINDNTEENIPFIVGTSSNRRYWDILEGAAEFTNDKIILTSNAKGQGLLFLKECDNLRDFNLNVDLTGNKIGEQTIYLRAKTNLISYLAVKVIDNHLYVSQKETDKEKILFEIDLSEVDDTSGADGKKESLTEISYREYGNRNMEISVFEDSITVWIDGTMVVNNLTVSHTDTGGIFLQSGWSDQGFSERNLLDDVYDGVFENLYLREYGDSNRILFDQRLDGLEKFQNQITLISGKVVDWFIENL